MGADIDLIDRLKANDESAMAELYERYSPAVYKTALRALPTQDADDAFDIVQEVFFQFFRRLDTFDPEKGKLLTYLMILTKRKCIDYLRRRQVGGERRRITLDEAAHELETHEASASLPGTHVDGDLILMALSKLSSIEQEVVRLSLIEGFTATEIAKSVGVSPSAVRTRISRALAKLRMILRDEIEAAAGAGNE